MMILQQTSGCWGIVGYGDTELQQERAWFQPQSRTAWLRRTLELAQYRKSMIQGVELRGGCTCFHPPSLSCSLSSSLPKSSNKSSNIFLLRLLAKPDAPAFLLPPPAWPPPVAAAAALLLPAAASPAAAAAAALLFGPIPASAADRLWPMPSCRASLQHAASTRQQTVIAVPMLTQQAKPKRHSCRHAHPAAPQRPQAAPLASPAATAHSHHSAACVCRLPLEASCCLLSCLFGA